LNSRGMLTEVSSTTRRVGGAAGSGDRRRGRHVQNNPSAGSALVIECPAHRVSGPPGAVRFCAMPEGISIHQPDGILLVLIQPRSALYAIARRHTSASLPAANRQGCAYSASPLSSSVAPKALRRNDGLKRAQIEVADLDLSVLEAVALLASDSGKPSSHARYPACSSTSSATASRQRTGRERRSVGLRYLTFGGPAASAWAARYRACRSAGVSARSPYGFGPRSPIAENQRKTQAKIGCRCV
jgi:hypothetical protein